MIDDDEDDWDRVKMGRFSDADERIVEGIFGKRHRLFRSSSRAAHANGKARRKSDHGKRDTSLPSRASVIERGYRYASGREVVVKARSRPKSAHGVMKLMHYVGRLRPEDERKELYGSVSLLDGFGAPLSVGDIQVIPERWDLASDNDN